MNKIMIIMILILVSVFIISYVLFAISTGFILTENYVKTKVIDYLKSGEYNTEYEITRGCSIYLTDDLNSIDWGKMDSKLSHMSHEPANSELPSMLQGCDGSIIIDETQLTFHWIDKAYNEFLRSEK